MPNGLLIGRYQTLHEGHDWLIEQVEAMGLHPVLAVRETPRGPKDPLPSYIRLAKIWKRYGDDRVTGIIIPDIKGVYYGRDVGYDVKELVPPQEIAAISGTKIRERAG
jgi:nicotinamide mononucleotide adenylyltransferase